MFLNFVLRPFRTERTVGVATKSVPEAPSPAAPASKVQSTAIPSPDRSPLAALIFFVPAAVLFLFALPIFRIVAGLETSTPTDLIAHVKLAQSGELPPH